MEENTPTKRRLQLTMPLRIFSAHDPGGWKGMLEFARIADSAGVDKLTVSDHVVFGERLEEYGRPEIGGKRGGTQPTGPDGHWLEPLTTLSVVSGITSRVRLATNVLLAALRRPVVLAKQAATLDVLSGGRLDLGVGVGWQREEYDAAGLDFENRGRLLDHALEVCQTLWRETSARYDSPELRFESIHMMPKPLQPGGVPIWVSGTVNRRVVKRLIRFGSGWIPWGQAEEDVVPAIAEMRERIAAAGGDASQLQVCGYLPLVRRPNGDLDLDRTMEGIPRLAQGGVTDFRAPLPGLAENPAALETVSEFVAAFRAVADQL